MHTDMDIRKLTAGETFSTGNELVPEISFHIGTDSDFRVGVSAEMDEKDGDILNVAAELVRRYNAHNELIAMVKRLMRNGLMQAQHKKDARALLAIHKQ